MELDELEMIRDNQPIKEQLMNAIEIETEVNDEHCIHVKLPDDWSPQKVKVIVLQEDKTTEKIEKRQFGGLEGKIHIADGFDDELPDSFWLDEEK